jgi:hypothetical protein
MKVDWKAYFREFSAVHGGEPILYLRNPESRRSGYLLFPDGWMYSSWNVEGPEYPPPADEKKHRALIRAYWTIRKGALEVEYDGLYYTTQSLMRAQQQRSARLQVPEIVVVEDDNGKRRKHRQSTGVDFHILLGRLSELVELIKVCKDKISKCEVPENFVEVFKPAALLTELQDIETARVGNKERVK